MLPKIVKDKVNDNTESSVIEVDEDKEVTPDRVDQLLGISPIDKKSGEDEDSNPSSSSSTNSEPP